MSSNESSPTERPGTHRLLVDLDAQQREAVSTPELPLRILAAAGSGKTRVLTRRIAYRVDVEEIDPRRVLAITFTRKAADELESRLRQLGLRDAVVAGTFHGIAYAQLRSRWAERGITAPSLLSNRDAFITKMCASSGHRRDGNAVAAEIGWARAHMVSAADYPAAASEHKRRPPLAGGRIAELIDMYEQQKNKKRLVDFDDLLGLCLRYLKDDKTFAEAQRWRFRHFHVDEFQDVNPLQFALLSAWLGDRNDLCVVGDPNQSIYSWNGADATYLMDLGAYVGACKTVTLGTNYRSSGEIVAAAGRVLGDDAPKQPNTVRAEGKVPTVTAYADTAAEAAGVARAVRDGDRQNMGWRSQAVLARTRAALEEVADALSRAGIPQRMRGIGNEIDPTTRAEAIELLREIDGPLQRSLGDLVLISPEIAQLARSQLAADPLATTSSLTDWLQTGRGLDDHFGDAVELATFHAAKGLEWRIVHIVGCEDGLIPHWGAKTPAAKDEERRLFYVALTRASEQASCSWSRSRTLRSGPAPREASPFLKALDVGEGSLVPDADEDQQVATIASVRSKLGIDLRDRPHADEVRAALIEWRAHAALRARIEPTGVLADRDLSELVAARPITTDEVAEIIGPIRASRLAPEIVEAVLTGLG